jgi:hypothetical protein
VYWCRTFIRFHGIRHPAEVEASEVDAFFRRRIRRRMGCTSSSFGGLTCLRPFRLHEAVVVAELVAALGPVLVRVAARADADERRRAT